MFNIAGGSEIKVHICLQEQEGPVLFVGQFKSWMVGHVFAEPFPRARSMQLLPKIVRKGTISDTKNPA